MAFVASRLGSQLRNVIALSSRCYSKKDVSFINPLDLVTGNERDEILALRAGNPDPYDTQAVVRGPNSKSNPIKILSNNDSRMVGCICEEDSGHVIWFWLHKGEPQRCECGHWFKLLSAKE